MKKIYVPFLVASVLAFSACQENDMEIMETPGDRIEVDVLSSDAYATKSADFKGEPIATYKLSDEGDKPLYLHVYKSLNRDLPFSYAPKTKGAEITLDSLKKDASGFSIEGYLGDGKPAGASAHFLSDSVFFASDQWVMTTEYPWLAGVPTTFWSYYPSSTASINGTRAITLPGDTDAQDAISFTYTLPTPATSSPFNDAKNQQDLLFAYSNRTWAKGQTGIVGIKFEHALAAIKFDVSDVTSSFGVSNIAFKGIHSSGKCVATVSNDSTVFTWSELGDVLKYSQDFTDADFEGGVQNRSKSDKMFFVIPQDLGSTAQIEVTFTPASGQTALTEQVKSLPIDKIVDPEDPDAYLDVVWEAGYVYTYELSYDPFAYQFGLSVAADSLKTFTNTSANSAETIIPVNSKKTFTGQTPVDHDWEIVSYQIGSGLVADYSQSKLEQDGGLSIVKDGNNIKVVSFKRDSVDRGSHDYWINTEGRTDNLDWSPADWTTSTASAPIDLSRFDFSTDMATVDMNTANCYIVRHPGTYKIPLVYGNAITAGNHNAASFQGISGSNLALNGFRKSHDNKAITNGLIENNTTDGNALAANRSNAIKATTAKVLWQDNAKVIKEVKLVGDPISSTTSYAYTTDPAETDRYVRYIQFTVDKETICQNNAVITVEDANGILWSWHIWVTNDPAVLASAIPVKNHDNVQYDFFPISDIGFVEPKKYLTREDVTLTLRQKDSGLETTVVIKQPGAQTNTDGTHYQWGRKDPFPQKGLPNSPALAEGTIYTQASTGVTFALSIQKPNYFFTSGTTQHSWWAWSTSNCYYNLWMGKTMTTGILNKSDDIIKTVYDPCPSGYMVPPSAAFTGFTKTGSNSDVAGVNDSTIVNIVKMTQAQYAEKQGVELYTQGWKTGPTIFFHKSNLHHFETGKLTSQSVGNYFTSGVRDVENVYRMRISNKVLDPDFPGYENYGFAVRPVKESDYVPAPAPTSYAFNLVNDSDASQTFTNTSANSSETIIPVNSKKTTEGYSPVDHDWEIASYKIGSSDYVDYDKDGLETAAGLTVVKDGNNIKVTSLAREPILKGSHNYWLNGGTANDWSPADWTTATASAPVDLSKFDFATDTKNAHPMHTANCYVIRHAGTYKFPLVYGNAVIPDGTSVKANTSAYNPAVTDTEVLPRFLDYNGHGITNPFIENNTTDGNAKSVSNSYLKVTGAAVQWQDKASVIKNVTIVDGSSSPSTSGNPYTASSVRYVQFTVDKNLVCQNNAVISVTDASGNIIWSWHIWVTNDPGLVSSSIPVTNTKGTFNFFPVPCLGWIEPPYYPEMDDVTLELVQNDSGKKLYVNVKRSEVHDPGNGTYYQFGRKDPMPDKDGISGAFTKNTTKLEDGVSLESGIRWPHHFWARIFDVGDWLTNTYYNLWTGTMKSTSANATAGIKTVYDPSPVGYRVPVPAAFAGFCDESGQCEDKTKWNVTDTDMTSLKGYKFETGNGSATIFFPAAGYRKYVDGTIDRLGLNAYFGTAIPKAPMVDPSGRYAFGFGFSGKYIWTQDYFARADGVSIRPVKE